MIQHGVPIEGYGYGGMRAPRVRQAYEGHIRLARYAGRKQLAGAREGRTPSECSPPSRPTRREQPNQILVRHESWIGARLEERTDVGHSLPPGYRGQTPSVHLPPTAVPPRAPPP